MLSPSYSNKETIIKYLDPYIKYKNIKFETILKLILLILKNYPLYIKITLCEQLVVVNLKP